MDDTGNDTDPRDDNKLPYSEVQDSVLREIPQVGSYRTVSPLRSARITRKVLPDGIRYRRCHSMPYESHTENHS